MTTLAALFTEYKKALADAIEGKSSLDIKNIHRYAEAFENYSANILGKNWGADTTGFEVAIIRTVFSAIAPNIKPRVIIDIGANVGDYTNALLETFDECEIHAFEPNIVNLDRLKERFSGNSSVSIVPYGASDTTGDGILWSCEPGSALASLAKRNLDHYGVPFNIEEHIKLVRFEDYWLTTLNSAPIDIAKIDVEGHELAVLKGFGKALKNTRVVQFEFSSGNIESRTFFQDFWYLLSAHGFNIFRITPLGLMKIDKYKYDLEFFTLANYIAINTSQTIG
ncbi:hypothetical protein MASR1M60_21540 [Rhodocyclaceae bacterium]